MGDLDQLTQRQWHQIHHWMSARLVDMAFGVSQQWERIGMASPRSTADRTPWVRQMHLQLVRTAGPLQVYKSDDPSPGQRQFHC